MSPWIYVLLMVLVMLLTSYETIWSYREFRRSKEKIDLLRFIGKIICLIILIVILVGLINMVLNLVTT